MSDTGLTKEVMSLGEKTIQYYSGDFDSQGGSLIFSCSKIEIEIHEKETVNGSFTIEEQSGRQIQGSIYTSEGSMHCNQHEMCAKIIECAYYFESDGMAEGDIKKGFFYIISNMGEYSIPYVVTMVHDYIKTSLGTIKNLFHFTNLAKSSWNEAVKVFYSEHFETLMTGNDTRYKCLYRGLSDNQYNEENLEEFLIGIHKKQKMEFIPDRDSLKVENPEETAKCTIRVDRNGWGYTALHVTTEGSFLEIEKETYGEDDFLGSSCHIPVYIRADRLHDGKNFGSIIFSYRYGTFNVKVTVIHNRPGSRNSIAHKQKSIVYSLTRHYLDFRMKRISIQKWLTLTNDLLTCQKSMYEENEDISLFEAHILITQERYNEAKWILDHKVSDPEKLDNTRYSYYLYLTTLYNIDEPYTKDVAQRVASLYRQDETNWHIGWLLLYLSAELNHNAMKKFTFAMRQVENGCTSPIFYFEIVSLLNSQPSLLLHMGESEKRVLMFGLKQDILTKELLIQISGLALRMKQYDAGVISILSRVYEKTKYEEAVQAACVLLIKDSHIEQEYFSWYERAVTLNLPLTRLYEYYMMSLNINQEIDIPKRVLMYFSYQSTLDVTRNAYLYAYVVRNKDKYPDIFSAYEEQIMRFTVKALYSQKLDRNLAFLYQEILTKYMLTPDNAGKLASLLLIHAIHVKSRDIVNVIVIDERLKKEQIYPVAGMVAYVPLVSNEYTLLLEDAKKRRYFGTEEYNTERFFLPRRFIPQVEAYAQEDLFFDLYLSEPNQNLMIITQENEKRYVYLLKQKDVTDEFKCLIRIKLLQFYFEQDHMAALDELLNTTQEQDIAVRERSEFVRLLTLRGMYQKAFIYATRYGTENIDPKILVRIATCILENEGFVEDEKLTYLIVSAFERGKYNEPVLRYLMQFYNGPVKNLRNIWRVASDFCVDTYAICEKMLIQTLETGAFIGEETKVFSEYRKGGAKTEVEVAYLSHYAYEYMLHDRMTEEYVFQVMEQLYHEEGELNQVCMLAYLKYYAQSHDRLQEQSREVIEEFIRELYVKRGIIMPYFQLYKDISIEALQLDNQSMVEYKGNPDSHVMIHYLLHHANDEESGYIQEEMQNMYGGIFVKSFLLFFGETLQYYITEVCDNKEQLTESGTIQKSDALGTNFLDRYSLLNDIAIADALKDYDTTGNLMQEYANRVFLTEQLFTPQ